MSNPIPKWEIIMHECEIIIQKNRDKNMKSILVGGPIRRYYGVAFSVSNRSWSLTQSTYFEEISHCPYCGQKLDVNLKLE